ncbi:hypothetical protein ACFWP7_07545 [Streptomyces sp. NPDC058470]|uniref:hypothetical protein n=1 Tax=Streptomyces sp. NPDC058470 TaxID=3346515 RepID=UPI0036549B07
MNRPSRPQSPTSEPEGLYEELHEAFAEAALDVTPSAVPIAAIERAGRRRRRRRTAAALGAACGVLLVPLAVVVLRADLSSGQGESERVTPPAASAGPTPSTSTELAGKVRIVTPGERVEVSPGTEIWLTEDGKHWSEPDHPTQFRSVSDGNLDLSSPGVSVQESTHDGVSFLSGIFHGPGEPARVEVRTVAGYIDGTALTLAGEPGWGVWYAEVKVPQSQTPTSDSLTAGVAEKVTVYDSAGGVIASQEFAT